MGGACGAGRLRTGFWWRDVRESDHLEDVGVDGRIIKMDLQDVGSGRMDWIDLTVGRDRWRAHEGECGNEHSGSIKCGISLDLLRACWVLRKESAP